VAASGVDVQSTALPTQYARLLLNEIAHRQEVEKALRAALRRVRSSDEQLRDFVENATLALHRVGADGTILWANRAELDLLGYTEQEYIGRPIADFHADAEVIADILARLTCGEELHNYEARMRAKDGSIKHVLISSSVYRRDGEFVHTRCFTRDVTERRRAEEALREREEQLRIVTDALPVLVSFVGTDERYRFTSAAYERWFGYGRAELVGKKIEEVMVRDAYAAIKPHIERALSGSMVTFEAEIPYLDSRTRFIEATYVPQHARDGSVSGFVALVADVSDRKRLEYVRAQAAERAERLLKITAAIADAVSAEQVFEALVDHVAEGIDASTVALWLVDHDSQTANLVHARGWHDAARRRFASVPLDMAPSIPALDSIRQRQPVWISTQAMLKERYPHLSAVATPGRSYRVACLPLLVHDHVLGTLGITVEEGREATPDEREFLLLVARYASQAIERLRLLESERRSRKEASVAAQRLGVLSDASRAFAGSALDLDSRLRAVVVELATAIGSCINIALLEPDGLLRFGAVHHPISEANELLHTLTSRAPVRMGEGVTGSVAATGESVILPSVAPDVVAARAVPAYREFLERFPVYALIGAPLRVRGRVIGTVTASRVRHGETYTTQDLHLLEELAERAAAAIENSRLYEETAAARTRAEQLYRFAQAVMAADRVEVVYEAALASIAVALGTRRAAILTFDAEGVMRFRAWVGLSDVYRAAVEGHSPWQPDAVAPQPVLVPDAAADPSMASYRALFVQERIGALAFIPLVTSGKLLGKFMLYYEQSHSFSSQEIETAGAIANHLASVITRFSVVAKLQETIRYNELFAGVLAHDLRNPLGAIMMAAQLMLRRQAVDAEPKGDGGPATQIVSSGRRMGTLIDQLLDVTRARAGGGIDVEPEATDLSNLCKQAVSELELSHPEWKIQCEVMGDQRGTWDSNRLVQVLSNLLANAGQHGTPNSPISVKLDGTDTEHVKISVHNAGAIPESLLPHLFDPFRSSQQKREQSRGLGLGLFIVREIVRGHGGSIDVSSAELTGTTFTIELPRHGTRRAIDERANHAT
jgi:PAS domain S-box-containing protein